jgi:flagellar motor switch protein FliN
MMTFGDCWQRVATALFSQALAGEPQLVESLPRPLGEKPFGFVAMISGEVEGRFSVLLDGAVLDTPFLGDGADQKAGWSELLREAVDAAAGDMLGAAGKTCRVTSFESVAAEGQVTRAFQLRLGDRAWAILVRDDVQVAQAKAEPAGDNRAVTQTPPLSPGFELLLDVELEASLRFGSREMPLGEILDLGPGDVVELDRHVSDPVDLIVGDKIVARGEVVLVNGNFGLRVTEVAAPKKRLESIRCLF